MLFRIYNDEADSVCRATTCSTTGGESLILLGRRRVRRSCDAESLAAFAGVSASDHVFDLRKREVVCSLVVADGRPSDGWT